jgi:putative aminopeptidase FrvX
MRCTGARLAPQIMNTDSKDFLKRLVETPSPSGYEHDVQKLVRERVCSFARIRNPDEVQLDRVAALLAFSKIFT